MGKQTDIYENVCKFTTEDIRKPLLKLAKQYRDNVEEIRLRNSEPINIYMKGKNFFISKNGELLKTKKDSLIVRDEDIKSTFRLITNHSVYAFSEEIKNGFITIIGGHRVGVGGKIIYGLNGVENIINISSLNFRIAREKKGISDFLIPYLLDKENNFYNSLIISPPQCGKTTLLRDIIRNLSNGKVPKFQGFKIGLIDERSEVAGIYKGISQNDVGIRTDILDGCLKSDGIMMLIRSMSPEIIAVDEIGGVKDIEAIGEGLRAGIKFIATIHGNDLDEIRGKDNLKQIINEKVFKRYIIMDRSQGVGTISAIIDGNDFKKIYSSGDLYDSY